MDQLFFESFLFLEAPHFKESRFISLQLARHGRFITARHSQDTVLIIAFNYIIAGWEGKLITCSTREEGVRRDLNRPDLMCFKGQMMKRIVHKGTCRKLLLTSGNYRSCARHWYWFLVIHFSFVDMCCSNIFLTFLSFLHYLVCEDRKLGIFQIHIVKRSVVVMFRSVWIVIGL